MRVEGKGLKGRPSLPPRIFTKGERSVFLALRGGRGGKKGKREALAPLRTSRTVGAPKEKKALEKKRRVRAATFLGKGEENGARPSLGPEREGGGLGKGTKEFSSHSFLQKTKGKRKKRNSITFPKREGRGKKRSAGGLRQLGHP